MRSAALASIAVLALLSPWHQSRAGTITLYRCAGAGGSVSFQDAPCGPGREQQVIEMEKPLPAPEPDAAPALPSPADPLATPEPQQVEATPVPAAPPALPAPPPLWRCRGLDKEPYFSETGTPPPRCLPLAAMGYDTSRLPPQLQGSCQNVHDECTPLRGKDLCRGWDALLEAAEGELRRAFSDTQAQRQAEVARLEGVVRGSWCR